MKMVWIIFYADRSSILKIEFVLVYLCLYL